MLTQSEECDATEPCKNFPNSCGDCTHNSKRERTDMFEPRPKCFICDRESDEEGPYRIDQKDFEFLMERGHTAGQEVFLCAYHAGEVSYGYTVARYHMKIYDYELQNDETLTKKSKSRYVRS